MKTRLRIILLTLLFSSTPLFSQATICYDKNQLEVIANKIEKGRQFQEENIALKHEIDTLIYQIKLIKTNNRLLESINNNNNKIINNSSLVITKLEEENTALRSSLSKANKTQRNTLIIGGCIVIGISAAAIIAIIAK
jgi:hypothetical protein